MTIWCQPWCTPFPIWNQSVFSCLVLTLASWPAYRFLKRQVGWSGIPISFRIFQFIVIHTVKGFGIVLNAEIDVFLELSCFFHDLVDVGNLISHSSAFSKICRDLLWALHSIGLGVYFYLCTILLGFPGSSMVENQLINSRDAGDANLIPGLGRIP